jgi:uncharacterized protein YutE (UPF0331/DUF86 family)
MVDPERVRRLLAMVDNYHDHLATLRDLPVETYLAEQAFAGRYLVQAAAQACIDVTNHVIASEGWRVPKDHRDAFTVLEEQDVLADELADRLRALAGLRNRLVHLYDDVDDRLVHEFLQDRLTDLEAFAATVARLAAEPDR